MSSIGLTDFPNELLLEIMGHLVSSVANGPDAVITIDLNLDYNPSNQTSSRFRVRTNFSLSPLHADSRMRRAYLASIHKIEITLCLRTTEAAYNLPGTLPRPWLLATRLLVQEVHMTDEAFEKYSRGREDAQPVTYSINKDTLPNLQAMLVSIKSGTRKESSVSMDLSDWASFTPEQISCRVLSRIIKEFRPFFDHELLQLLAYRPSDANTWFPTMMISVNVNIFPYGFPPGAPAFLQSSSDRRHRVLVKQGNDRNHFWHLRRTVHNRFVPNAFLANDFDKLYMRVALNPQMVRGERLMVSFVLKHPVDRRARVSRLQVWFDSTDTLREALSKASRGFLLEPLQELNIWNPTCGYIQPHLRLLKQGVKQGGEFIVSLKSEDEEEADQVVEDNRRRLKLWG